MKAEKEIQLAGSRGGRVVLHAFRLVHGGGVVWCAKGIIREIRGV